MASVQDEKKAFYVREGRTEADVADMEQGWLLSKIASPISKAVTDLWMQYFDQERVALGSIDDRMKLWLASIDPVLNGGVGDMALQFYRSGPSFYLPLNKGSIKPLIGNVAPTFTRATTATVADWENVVRPVLSGEARFQGLRRVRNHLTNTENLSHADWTKTNASVIGSAVTFAAGTSAISETKTTTGLAVGTTIVFSVVLSGIVGQTVRLVLDTGGGTYQATVATVALTSSPTRYSVTLTLVTDTKVNIRAALDDNADTLTATTFTMTNPQLEDVTGQSNQNPGEYVSAGVLAAPYQGAAVDGVQCFPSQNGNAVQQNLALQSQTLDNASWLTTQATVIANAAIAPDGTLTAEKVAETAAAAAEHKVFQSSISVTAGGIYTWSAYVKAAERTWVILNAADSGDRYSWFNLATGTVGTLVAGATGSITPVGNGWYRISVTRTPAITSVYIQLQLADADASFAYNGVAGNGAYFWGAQIQPGARAGTYVPTTAAAVNNNIVEQGQAAMIATATRLGYLTEGARTNLCLQSQDQTNASWVKTALTVATLVAAPDGNTTANKCVPTAAASVHCTVQTFTKAASALPYSITVYGKADGYNFLGVRADDGISGIAFVCFNVSTGTISTAASGAGGYTAVSASITALANGWYQCQLLFTSNTTASVRVIVGAQNATGDPAVLSFTGDAASGVDVWGAQLEQATFASSYIPTTTVAVTRNADVLTYPMTGWYNQVEGSAVINFQTLATFGASSPETDPLSLNNAGLQVFIDGPSGGLFVKNRSDARQINTNFIVKNTTYKLAEFYKTGDLYGGSVNGAAIISDAQLTDSIANTTIGVGQNGPTNHFGPIASVAYYPRRLSNTELQVAST